MEIFLLLFWSGRGGGTSGGWTKHDLEGIDFFSNSLLFQRST